MPQFTSGCVATHRAARGYSRSPPSPPRPPLPLRPSDAPLSPGRPSPLPPLGAPPSLRVSPSFPGWWFPTHPSPPTLLALYPPSPSPPSPPFPYLPPLLSLPDPLPPSPPHYTAPLSPPTTHNDNPTTPRIAPPPSSLPPRVARPASHPLRAPRPLHQFPIPLHPPSRCAANPLRGPLSSTSPKPGLTAAPPPLNPPFPPPPLFFLPFASSCGRCTLGRRRSELRGEATMMAFYDTGIIGLRRHFLGRPFDCTTYYFILRRVGPKRYVTNTCPKPRTLSPSLAYFMRRSNPPRSSPTRLMSEAIRYSCAASSTLRSIDDEGRCGRNHRSTGRTVPARAPASSETLSRRSRFLRRSAPVRATARARAARLRDAGPHAVPAGLAKPK